MSLQISSLTPLKMCWILLLVGSALAAVSVHAMEAIVPSKHGAICSPDTRVMPLTANVSNTTQHYKNELSAIISCNAQNKFWDGTACTDLTVPAPPACTISHNIFNNTTTEINQAYVIEQTYTSPEVEVSRCHWFWDRGRKRNISRIYAVYSCITEPLRVEVQGQMVTIHQDTCNPNPRTELIWDGASRDCWHCAGLPLC
jgi:hypothetical protein